MTTKLKRKLYTISIFYHYYHFLLPQYEAFHRAIDSIMIFFLNIVKQCMRNRLHFLYGKCPGELFFSFMYPGFSEFFQSMPMTSLDFYLFRYTVRQELFSINLLFRLVFWVLAWRYKQMFHQSNLSFQPHESSRLVSKLTLWLFKLSVLFYLLVCMSN